MPSKRALFIVCAACLFSMASQVVVQTGPQPALGRPQVLVTAKEFEAAHLALWGQKQEKVARVDPYKNFRFRVKWDGKYVAGFSKVRGLEKTAKVVKHRQGGDPSTSRKSPGHAKYDAITLERGVTHDADFQEWAKLNWRAGSDASFNNSRKDIYIEVYNEAGHLVLTYKVLRCWVSEYQVTPDLDAKANAVAIQHIKLENEGWDSD